VKTEIIEKIPIVIPKSERNVLNLLTITELTANKKPSLKSLRNITGYLSMIISVIKDKKTSNMA
jgi:hypothetical protein